MVYQKNKNISGRLLVEGDQTIDTLCNSIRDMLEIFPKFSALDGLNVCKLTKKENNKWVDLIMNNIIKNDIKQKDIIYFDLEFTEVWIDVIMTVKDNDDENKINKFSFELKTELRTNITYLKNILINLGITSWKTFKDQEEQEEQDNKVQKDQDYYLLSKFEIILENEQNIKEKKSINNENVTENEYKSDKKDSNSDINFNDEKRFNFNDKIACILKFINFTKYICDYSINEIEKKNKINKSYDITIIDEIKDDFNNHFQDLYLNKTQKVIEINKILCKISKKYVKNEFKNVKNYPLNPDKIKVSSPTNDNFQIRYIGPYPQLKKSISNYNYIEMEEIRNFYPELSFKNGKSFQNDSFSNNNSSNSLKSASEEIEIKKEPEVDNKSYFGDEHNLEEIDFIRKINFDEILDKFDCEILDKELNSNDLYKARNLEYLDGEMLKFNKLNPDKYYGKKINKEQSRNTLISKVDNFYNNPMIKKYASILFIIILIILIFKIII